MSKPVRPKLIMPKLLDPLKGNRITLWSSRIKNPYISDVLTYLRDIVLPRVSEAVEQINETGAIVEYRFILDKPWYVVTPTETKIFEKEMRTSTPEKMVGGKMWLRLIVNERETSYDLEAEWNSREIRINLTAQELSALASSPLWNEEPRTSYLGGPDEHLIGSGQGESGTEKSKLQKTLENDIVNSLTALGSKKKDIDMEKVEQAAAKWAENPEDIHYNDLVGKAVTSFLRL